MNLFIRSTSGWILAASAMLAIQGCGGPPYEYDSVVTGTVTVDGELAKSGTVTFHPVDNGPPATGLIDSNGSYSLRTGQGDLSKTDGGTVKSGEYLVTVSITAPPAAGAVVGEGGPPLPGPSLIAAQYAQKGTTSLRVAVKPGKQVVVLNLEGPEPQPPADESADAPDDEAAFDADAMQEPTSLEGSSPQATNAPESAASHGEESETPEAPAP